MKISWYQIVEVDGRHRHVECVVSSGPHYYIRTGRFLFGTVTKYITTKQQRLGR